MLHDEAEIEVRSGHGGPGCVSFRREAFVPEGGPDGGDGGRGGDVVLVANPHLNSLHAFVRRRKWRAPNGRPGGPQKCTGADGDDLVLEVPPGTVVRHAGTGEVLADLTDGEARVVIAAGGKGGRGNTRFKKATLQVPRKAQPGESGVGLGLRLELKLIADVGLVGHPNAGKSTLLRRLSNARPKVGDYPFTTLDPHLGVVEFFDRQIVLADIPGLIEGAAEGAGLGHRFLRHIERCRLLLHLVDAGEGCAEELVSEIRAVESELARFSPSLAGKPRMVALNKADLRGDLAAVAEEVAALLGGEVLVISGVAGTGLDRLGREVLHLLDRSGSD